MQDKLLSNRDAATYLGLSPVTLAKWRCYNNPNQPKWISYGRAIRYRVSDLDAWVDSNSREAEPLEVVG